jgi:hypothetical protein
MPDSDIGKISDSEGLPLRKPCDVFKAHRPRRALGEALVLNAVKYEGTYLNP